MINSYVLYLLITTIYGCQLLENPIDIHLQVNEFIMPAVLQIYFNHINRGTLTQIIHWIMKLILLIKLCLCIFCNISRVNLQSRIQDDVWRCTLLIRGFWDVYNGVQNTCRTNHCQLLFRRHMNDDSKYYLHTVSHKRKLNEKQIRPDPTWTCLPIR